MSHALVIDFETRRAKHFDQEIAKRESREKNRVSPRNPIASNINQDCIREMVLAMRHPEEKIIRDHDRLERFEDAIAVASRTRRELENYGYDITDVESSIPPVKDRGGNVVITGIVDFVVRFGDKKIPVEVKSPNAFVFEKLHTVWDLDHHWWMKKWVDQLLVYLYATGNEEGFILLVCFGEKRWVHIDLNNPEMILRAEAALQVAEIASEMNSKGDLPDFASDLETCTHCWAFGVVCQPPIESQAVGHIDDEEFYAMAERAEEIKTYHSEYEGLWKKITKIIKATGSERVICRDVAFSVKERPVKEFTVKARVDRIVKMFRVGKEVKS